MWENKNRVIGVAAASWAACSLIGGAMLIGCGRPDNNSTASVETASAPIASRPSVKPSAAPSVAATSGVKHWFYDVTRESGVDFRHVSGDSSEKPFPAANGGGVGAFDYDLDGWVDLYFASGTPFPLDASRRQPVDRFYRNRGRRRFEDVTALARLGHNGFSAGVAAGDVNNDGFPDLYVTCFGANVLYLNQGDGSFLRDANAQLDDKRWATSAAFLDYNADGALDLYVCNYGKWNYESRLFCGDRTKNVRLYCSPNSVEAEQDALFENLGDGRFADRAEEAGVAQRAGRAQGVIAADLNNDGWTDIYVGNDLHANSLFLNQRNGSFRDATEMSGVGYDHRGGMQAGMGVDAADLNGDGKLELFVTNFKDEPNTLYENHGNAIFQDTSSKYGLAADSLPYVGWGAAFADFDLDGRLDLVVTNGHVDNNRYLLGQDAPYAVPPLLWRYREGKFELLHAAAGKYFQEKHVGRGLLAVDFDNDRDQDLVITHQDALPALLENRLGSEERRERTFVFKLVGVRSNRDAIGAEIKLLSDQQDQVRVRQVMGGGSYLSSRELSQPFVIDSNETRCRLEIRWPDGGRSELAIPATGGKYIVVEPWAASGTSRIHRLGE